MVSAGLRIGAVPLLKIKHLERIGKDGGVYKVTAYADSKKDKYVTFTTPEATKAIDDYLKTREIKGEKLKPDSPLFRKEFDAKYANTDIRAVNKSGLFKLIQELTVNTGLRTLGHKAKSGYAPRHGTPLTHSFRKIANTAFVKAGIKPVVCEMLLGHNIGLQANYLRLSDEELLEEYQKAVELLTVGKERVLELENKMLRAKAGSVDDLRDVLVGLLESEKKKYPKDVRDVMDKLRNVGKGKD
jgi:hypothetical protein